MLRMGRFALTLTIFSMVAGAQDDPLAWFPLQVGSRWVYEHEWKSGDRNRPDLDRWTVEETITARVTIPEGLVVVREVKQRASVTDKNVTVKVITPNGQVREVQQPGYNRGVATARDREPYLVRGNCMYLVTVPYWDGQKQELRPQYRKYLIDGAVSPDFCFPLLPGRAWGNNDIPSRVEPPRESLGSLLPAEYAGAIHIFSDHFGSGGWKDVWFQKGVGVVGEHYIHNGTYDEYTKKLVSFMP
jgi:hypothetical protein